MKKMIQLFFLMVCISSIRQNICDDIKWDEIELIEIQEVNKQTVRSLRKMLKDSVNDEIHTIKEDTKIIIKLLKKDPQNASIPLYLDNIRQSVRLVQELQLQLDALSCTDEPVLVSLV